MKIKTFSIVAGSEACIARCPFCVSKMTPTQGITTKEPEINLRNFHIAAKLAKQSGADTAMITSKGEPTLFPDQVSKYIDALKDYDFPFIELQTNGIPLAEDHERYDKFVKEWYDAGLTTVAISIVHYDAEKNRQIYLPYKREYIDLPGFIDYLHNEGLSVRLGCVMLDNHIDSPSELEKLVDFAIKNKVEQLTIRPVNKPGHSRNQEVYDWTLNNYLPEKKLEDITGYLNDNGIRLLDLPHGGTIYDLHGQNVCLTNSLTRNDDPENMRQIIFFPDGHIRYDWEHTGAILI